MLHYSITKPIKITEFNKKELSIYLFIAIKSKKQKVYKKDIRLSIGLTERTTDTYLNKLIKSGHIKKNNKREENKPIEESIEKLITIE